MTPSLACAIYTRKSSEEGLEQDFNSLAAQREACEAYVLSQKHEGWQALPDTYDDGGYSGGNMERPALARLLGDIVKGRIRIVVVYKVDRLTRSLADFARIIERFDAEGVSFVSVTQQFNTTTSMGRLTLNVLLSFAQFEREVTGERIRDKIAASKKKGMWMGGLPPVGYRPHERSLVIDEPQAERIREMYRLYLDLGSVRELKKELDHRGWLTPPRRMKRANAAGDRPFSRGHLYRILANPVYLGRISHKGMVFEGRHPAIVDQDLWDRVQGSLDSNRQGSKDRVTAKEPSLLAGLVFDGDGKCLTPTHSCKGTRRYRYYVSSDLVGRVRDDVPAGLRIPAHELEAAVRVGITSYLSDHHRLLGDAGVSEMSAVRELIAKAEMMTSILATGIVRESIDLLGQLIERVTVLKDHLEIRLRRMELTGGDAGGPVLIAVPAQFRRCGLGIRLVVTPREHSRTASVDHRLVRLVDRGIGWFRRMTSSAPEGVGVIAKSERVAPSFVIRLTYLAFLAPDIVESIRDGRQPATLTVDRLTRSVPLPMDWATQRALLGFAATQLPSEPRAV